ncbi:MAG TPA: mannose-1-phosphate guanylyltransferase [Aggregatilineales bacterium]|nr:mannose-1-phosphate guanylyltransferase [Aggregatilineales bacterium]
MRHLYALIMAGGGGTRLWPLSRREHPKQVLALTEDRTMFQVTVDRLSGLIPPEQIFVVAGRSLAPLLRDSTPQIPVDNFIIEPEGRDSGPAAGLGTYAIHSRDPDAVVAVLSADHHIANEDRFICALRAAHNYAIRGLIVTLGIEPLYPATGFGYIQRGNLLDECGEFSVYKSIGFTEKPDETTATRFVASGKYSWNAGMFIWQTSRAIDEFARQQPEMDSIFRYMLTGRNDVDDKWQTVNKLSLDYAIMEKAINVVVIPVDIGWTDVGNWATLFAVLRHDDHGNAMRSNSDQHLNIDTHDTLIVSDKMVVTIGMENVVIVDTDDAILVCQKDRAQDVKQVVQHLKAVGQEGRL